jgi:hypothetical protein
VVVSGPGLREGLGFGARQVPRHLAMEVVQGLEALQLVDREPAHGDRPRPAPGRRRLLLIGRPRAAGVRIEHVTARRRLGRNLEGKRARRELDPVAAQLGAFHGGLRVERHAVEGLAALVLEARDHVPAVDVPIDELLHPQPLGLALDAARRRGGRVGLQCGAERQRGEQSGQHRSNHRVASLHRRSLARNESPFRSLGRLRGPTVGLRGATNGGGRRQAACQPRGSG